MALRRIVTLAIVSVFVAVGFALAQDKPADATLKLSEGSVAAGIGYSWGKGTLTYKGRDYPVKVSGLSVGQVGVSKVEATGRVFNLAKLEDFNGTYAAAGAEGTLAGGVGAATMKNQNGVVINLTSTAKGVNLKLAAEGVKLTLAQP